MIAVGQIDRVNDQYAMHVRLDTATHTLSGKTTLTWTNPDNQPVDHMLFHMYYNAFKNSESTFFTEDQFPDLRPKNTDNCYWSHTTIVTITDDQNNDLSNTLSYVQPDDNNIKDQSVLRVDLAIPVHPNETITLTFDWEAKIPNIMPRTGYNKEYYFFAQWFPKLGVYETEGMRYAKKSGWNCHQYHANGEYYGEFADYTVSMVVPKSYVIASSGTLQDKTVFDSTSTQWTFLCKNVIDFTWSASPYYTLQEDNYKDTKLLFYTYPYKADIADRYFNAIKFCMQYLDEKLGDYPYPTLSIIDPPIHGMFTGGMEYPTLITSISFNFFPEGFRTPETLAMHEFIHQYFMQMIASHEVEEPWMDEGFTTYWEGRILDEYLGEDCSMICFGGYTLGTKEYNRFEYLNSSYNTSGPNTLKSYEFEGPAYGPISYNKTALWLQTLERLLGRELMDTIWKTYFERWQYKHPCGQDFIDVVNEVTVQQSSEYSDGMDWFFDQVLYGTGLCDYSIEEIRNETIQESHGFIYSDTTCDYPQPTERYHSTITVKNKQSLQFPLRIKVKFENGETSIDTFSMSKVFHTLAYNTQYKITEAVLDPDTLLYIDRNLTNNSYSTTNNDSDINNKIRSKLQGAFQNLLEFLSILI